MIDRLFSAALTFCLLAAGTLAIGSALFEGKRPAQAQTQPRVVQLPMVEVVGKRVDNGTAWARTEGDEPVTNKLQ